MGRVYCVIPVHNRLACLRRCLADLSRQNFEDLFIVVVDDGSTDGTAEWLAGQQGPKLTVLRGDGSLWWGGAMRLGMEHVLQVAGPDDYLLMMNDDVTVEPDYVRSLVAASEREGGAVVGSMQLSDASDDVLDCGYRIDYLRMAAVPLQTPADRELMALSGRGTLYPMRLVRRAGVIRSGLFPHYFGDLEYSARVRELGGKLTVSAAARIRTEARSSDHQIRARRGLAMAFSRRSKSNLVHRAIFFSVSGPLWLRVWAVPRLICMTLLRGGRRWFG